MAASSSAFCADSAAIVCVSFVKNVFVSCLYSTTVYAASTVPAYL